MVSTTKWRLLLGDDAARADAMKNTLSQQQDANGALPALNRLQ
jgi:hypothetical protein